MGLGIAGTLTEIGRIKKADMKGLDDLIVGLLLTVVSVVVILKFRNVALNIGLFINVFCVFIFNIKIHHFPNYMYSK